METVTVDIPKNAALVLFEFLSRSLDDGDYSVKHPSEAIALSDLLAVLEKELTEPIDAKYLEILDAARKTMT